MYSGESPGLSIQFVPEYSLFKFLYDFQNILPVFFAFYVAETLYGFQLHDRLGHDGKQIVQLRIVEYEVGLDAFLPTFLQTVLL